MRNQAEKTQRFGSISESLAAMIFRPHWVCGEVGLVRHNDAEDLDDKHLMRSVPRTIFHE